MNFKRIPKWNFIFFKQERKQQLFSTAVFRQSFDDLLLGSFARLVRCVNESKHRIKQRIKHNTKDTVSINST